MSIFRRKILASLRSIIPIFDKYAIYEADHSDNTLVNIDTKVHIGEPLLIKVDIPAGTCKYSNNGFKFSAGIFGNTSVNDTYTPFGASNEHKEPFTAYSVLPVLYNSGYHHSLRLATFNYVFDGNNIIHISLYRSRRIEPIFVNKTINNNNFIKDAYGMYYIPVVKGRRYTFKWDSLDYSSARAGITTSLDTNHAVEQMLTKIPTNTTAWYSCISNYDGYLCFMHANHALDTTLETVSFYESPLIKTYIQGKIEVGKRISYSTSTENYYIGIHSGDSINRYFLKAGRTYYMEASWTGTGSKNIFTTSPAGSYPNKNVVCSTDENAYTQMKSDNGYTPSEDQYLVCESNIYGVLDDLQIYCYDIPDDIN